MDVTVKQSAPTERTYQFERVVSKQDMNFLDQSNDIEDYSVQGKDLTVTAKRTADWDTLESTVIGPGFKKLFGEPLNIKSHASSGNRS